MSTSPLDDNRNRDYEVHHLHVISNREGEPVNQALLIELYKEMCQSWRALLDIRFKLLTVVPSSILTGYFSNIFKRPNKKY